MGIQWRRIPAPQPANFSYENGADYKNALIDCLAAWESKYPLPNNFHAMLAKCNLHFSENILQQRPFLWDVAYEDYVGTEASVQDIANHFRKDPIVLILKEAIENIPNHLGATPPSNAILTKIKTKQVNALNHLLLRFKEVHPTHPCWMAPLFLPSFAMLITALTLFFLPKSNGGLDTESNSNLFFIPTALVGEITLGIILGVR